MVLTEVGTHPSVKHLVYLDTLMLDAGETQADILTEEDHADEFWRCVQADDAGFAFETDALAVYLEGRGYSAVDAQESYSDSGPQLAAVSVENSVVAWRSVPSTFISCDDSEIDSDLRALFASGRPTSSRFLATTFRCGCGPARSRKSSPKSRESADQ